MPARTSLGITRSFPRLYPTMGLVTVALLSLSPLALRPVRLACLIHAANVHSEPGSNPSKMSRSPAIGRTEAAHPPAPGPHPKGVEESDWSHRRSVSGRDPDGVRPDPPRGGPSFTTIRLAAPRRTSAGPACHPDIRSPVDPPGRMSSRRTHAGFPQGFLTRRNLTYFVSLCLADECYRPNCQRIESAPGSTCGLSAGFEPGTRNRAPLTITRRCRPVQGAFEQLTPAVVSAIGFVREAKAIVPEKSPRSTTHPGNSLEIRATASVPTPDGTPQLLGKSTFPSRVLCLESAT